MELCSNGYIRTGKQLIYYDNQLFKITSVYLFIVNQFLMNIVSRNPANGKPLKTYRGHSPKQVDQKILQTHKAWLNWKNTGHEERSKLLTNMAGVLQTRKSEFAVLMAQP